MRKLFFLFLSLFLLASCKRRYTGERLGLTVGDIHSENYPTVIGCKEFAGLVYERSGGRIVVNVQTDVGSELALLEHVHSGKMDFARVSGVMLGDTCEEFRVLSMPYLFRDSGHFWNVLNGDIGRRLLAGLEEHGYIGLCYYESGARSFYFTRPVGNYEELQGMKIRVQNNSMMVDFVRAIGAIPYPIEYEDVYAALANGAIVGAENNVPSYWVENHHVLARYYLLDEHMRIPEVLLGSKKVLSVLDAADMSLLVKAAADSVPVQRLAWEEDEREANRAIAKEGTIFLAHDMAKSADKLKAAQRLLDAQLSEEERQIINEIRATK